ncbi:MAG: hypothetical protein AAFV88_17385 [Planctomycetota bacterium]
MRIASFAALLLASWCVMTLTHECGHLVGGACCGATLKEAELAPWRLPYSLHSPDPHPQITLWCGPILGVLIPVSLAWLIHRDSAWFIADFCVLANGSYLTLSWISGDRFLDAPRMLAAGTPAWLLASYCVITVSVGYVRFRNDCIQCLRSSPE